MIASNAVLLRVSRDRPVPGQAQVYLGALKERWDEAREAENLTSDQDLAKFLLDL